MKLLFLFNLILFSAFSQSDTIRVQKKLNYFPSIGGVHDGEIPFWKICDSDGIVTSSKSHVMSFDMQFWGKKGLQQQHIAGNQIPDSVCLQIGVYGLNNMIFFTNIKAILPDSGKVLHLSPMNLLPVKKDE